MKKEWQTVYIHLLRFMDNDNAMVMCFLISNIKCIFVAMFSLIMKSGLHFNSDFVLCMETICYDLPRIHLYKIYYKYEYLETRI